MRRFITPAVTAIESAAIALASLAGVAAVVFTVWVTTFSMQAEPGAILGTIAALWGLAHGAPLGLELDATLALSFGLPPEALTFEFSLIPLGVSLITVGLAARLGGRHATAPLGEAAVNLLSGTIGFAGVAIGIAWFGHGLLLWDPVPSGLFATLFFAVPAWLGLFVRHPGSPAASRMNARLRTLPGLRYVLQRHIIVRVFRLAAALGGALLMLAALAFVVALIVAYPEAIRVTQQLQLDLVGILVLLVLHLAYLPTMLAWTLAWLSGAGFAIGAGTTVSAYETLLGPVPMIPAFGLIPQGWGPWGVLSLAVIVLVGFGIGFLFGGLPEYRNPRLLSVLGTALVSLLLLGAALWLLMTLSHGALGPGRLADAGPDPLPTAALLAAEAGIGVLLGLALRRLLPQRAAPAAELAGADDSPVLVPIPWSRTRDADTDVVPETARAVPDADAQDTTPLTGWDDDVRDTSRVIDPFTAAHERPWFRRRGKKPEQPQPQPQQTPPAPDFDEDRLIDEYSWDNRPQDDDPRP